MNKLKSKHAICFIIIELLALCIPAITIIGIIFKVGVMSLLSGIVVFAYSEYKRLVFKNNSEEHKNIVPHIAFAIVTFGIGFYITFEYFLFNDNSRYFYVKMFLAGFIFLLIQIVHALQDFERHNLAIIYFVIAISFGIIYSLIYPMETVPDENSHIGRVYELSNQLMGYNDKEDGNFLLRKTDEGKIHAVTQIDKTGLEQYWNSFMETGNEDVHISYKPELYVATPWYQYVPQVIGMTIGRLLNLGFTGIVYMARVMGLLLFVILVSIAIKEIPVAKGLLFSVMLLPMTLQQAMGCTYDTFVISTIVLEIALTLRLLTEEDYKNKGNIIRIVAVVVLALLIFGVKGHAYFPISLLPLMIIIKKFKLDYKKIGRVFLILFGVGVVAFIVLAVMAQNGIEVLKDYNNINDALSSTGRLYTIPFLINNPQEIPQIIFNTISKQGAFVWFGSLIGIYYGWYQNSVDVLIGVGYIVVILLATIKRADDNKIQIRLGEKIYLFVAFILSVLFIHVGMLLNISLVVWHMVAGVQGRYLLPIIFIPFYLLGNNQIVTRKDQTRTVILLMLLLQYATVMGMLPVV